jgi:hypothetical protein
MDAVAAVLGRAFTGVLPTKDACAWIACKAIGGKDILPAPLLVGMGIFALQRERKIHAP